MENLHRLKKQVLLHIRQSGDNVIFKELTTATGLDAEVLSYVLVLLAEEHRVLIRVNHLREGEEKSESMADSLCARFLDLLFVHHRREHRVKFYASALCVTPRYLAAVVKSVSQKSPSEWISSKIISEAEYMLCHTQASVKEVAYELGFPCISSFGKFFKAQTGMAPKQFRTAHLNAPLPTNA